MTARKCINSRELFEFARSLARCPCCEQYETCDEDCTYADDATSHGLALMREARAAIAASPYGMKS